MEVGKGVVCLAYILRITTCGGTENADMFRGMRSLPRK
jgi:hypothetical protein